MLVAVFSLSCGKYPAPLDNDTIIRESKKCEDAGLDAGVLYNKSYEVWRVICFSKGSMQKEGKQ